MIKLPAPTSHSRGQKQKCSYPFKCTETMRCSKRMYAFGYAEQLGCEGITAFFAPDFLVVSCPNLSGNLSNASVFSNFLVVCWRLSLLSRRMRRRTLKHGPTYTLFPLPTRSPSKCTESNLLFLMRPWVPVRAF